MGLKKREKVDKRSNILNLINSTTIIITNERVPMKHQLATKRVFFINIAIDKYKVICR